MNTIADHPVNETIHYRTGSFVRASTITGSEFSTRVEVSEGLPMAFGERGAPKKLNSQRPKSGGKSEVRVKRRLQGFFIQEEGQDARVAFVENGNLIHYRLPISLFRDGRVGSENQPFELDELETRIEGATLTGYRVRPSAPVNASHVVPLPLDAERKAKLARILERRRDVQD